MASSISSRLPSLRALLAFETTARTLSIGKAAIELNLTPSAVSHSIVGLETQIGTKLFRRTRNGVTLTSTGRTILAEVRTALNHLGSAFAPPSSVAKQPAITVLPNFATRWLIPRLANLLAFAPDIRFKLLLTDEITEFEIDRTADAAIRYGPGGWPGLECVKLHDERVFPVCSPNYRGGNLPKTERELAHCALIANPWQPWTPLFDALGIEWDDDAAAVEITDSSMAIQAAVEGTGITLARGLLVSGELASGRLVRLFEIEQRTQYCYWVAWPKGTRKRAQIDTLVSWLQREMRKSD
jgi:LysR family glycine cleavage system transcriptional activator